MESERCPVSPALYVQALEFQMIRDIKLARISRQPVGPKPSVHRPKERIGFTPVRPKLFPTVKVARVQ